MLSEILEKMLLIIVNAYDKLSPYAHELLWYMSALSLTFLAFNWMLGKGEVVVDTVSRVLTIGFFTWLITDYPLIFNAARDFAVQSGILAGGSSITEKQFFSPSLVIDQGLKLSLLLMGKATVAKGILGVDFLLLMQFGLPAILLVILYAIAAAQIFVTILEFYIVAMLSVLLLPFGAFDKTRFLAEKALSVFIGYSFKLMMMGFIVSIASLLINAFATDNVTVSSALQMVVVGIVLVVLFWNVGALSSSLMTGGPSLSAASMAGVTFSMALASTAVATLATRAASLIGSSITSGAGMGAGLFRSMQTGYNHPGGKYTPPSGKRGGIPITRGERIGGAIGGASKYIQGSIGERAERVKRNFKEAIQEGRNRADQRNPEPKQTGGYTSFNRTDKNNGHSNKRDHPNKERPNWIGQLYAASHITSSMVPHEASSTGGVDVNTRTKG